MRQSHHCRVASRHVRLVAAAGIAALSSWVILPSSTETAVANGDTRTLNLYHSHTGESIQATYRVNGSYDSAVLEKLNWFLRDWRNNDRTRMDPRLFDVVWEAYRTAGATQPIVIISAYRSPQTNSMLRRRSSGVAEHSQHILGRAMDTTMPGMPMEKIREIGMRLQRGGVGWYPGSNFVHLDVASVRAWPRMRYDQLARIFPDGKTVHLAADGRALPRYAEARAELASRGAIMTDVAQAAPGGGLFAWLFGRTDEVNATAATESVPRQAAAPPARGRRGAIELASLRANGTRPVPASLVAPDRGAARPANTASASAHDRPSPATGQIEEGAERPQVAALGPAPALRGVGAANDQSGGGRLSENAESDALYGNKFGKRAALSAIVPLPPPRPAQSGDESAIAFADVPTPPSRPIPAQPKEEFTFAAVPTPPSRPASLTRLAALQADKTAIHSDTQALDAIHAAFKAAATGPDADASLARAASLPVVITQGPRDQESLPKQVLAFAPQAPVQDKELAAQAKTDSTPTPSPPSQTLAPPARLDRARHRGHASGLSATFPAPSLLGQSLTGLRRAARLIPGALSNKPSAANYVSAFGTTATDLDPDRFTGTAAKPLALAQGFVRIANAPAPYIEN
ncbi:MAG: DUF882 domain-containing protein [Beijerinckiaceae bacterium]|nr:DUF882 domain-containing protein [Beijerinckiaceae bacterium]MCI0734692.1 DUF882 domain-containing protein [Beijerinckiaceae bacterium]